MKVCPPIVLLERRGEGSRKFKAVTSFFPPLPSRSLSLSLSLWVHWDKFVPRLLPSRGSIFCSSLDYAQQTAPQTNLTGGLGGPVCGPSSVRRSDPPEGPFGGTAPPTNLSKSISKQYAIGLPVGKLPDWAKKGCLECQPLQNERKPAHTHTQRNMVLWRTGAVYVCHNSSTPIPGAVRPILISSSLHDRHFHPPGGKKQGNKG